MRSLLWADFCKMIAELRSWLWKVSLTSSEEPLRCINAPIRDGVTSRPSAREATRSGNSCSTTRWVGEYHLRWLVISSYHSWLLRPELTRLWRMRLFHATSCLANGSNILKSLPYLSASRRRLALLSSRSRGDTLERFFSLSSMKVMARLKAFMSSWRAFQSCSVFASTVSNSSRMVLRPLPVTT